MVSSKETLGKSEAMEGKTLANTYDLRVFMKEFTEERQINIISIWTHKLKILSITTNFLWVWRILSNSI